MGTLEGRVALVTGASSGIGAEIARTAAREGAAVAVHGRDRDAAEAVAQSIADAGGRAVVVLGDLSLPAEADRVVRETETALGPVDILIANAGGNPVAPGPIESMTLDQWQSVVDANLTLTFVTIAAVLPGMKQRGAGSIVTTSSAASRRPTAQSPAAYAAAKAGIEVLTQMVALQAGPSGVRANCIAPETILTEKNEQRIPVAIQEQLANAHTIARLGIPRDVAEAVVFLASDAASWITGVTLDVAGGSVIA